MSKEIKLTPSQRQLVVSWEKEFTSTQQRLNDQLNELMLFRLEKIADEIGIDIENEKWTFDFQKRTFVMIEEPKEVTPTIPGRNTTKSKVYQEEGDEVIDVEAEEENTKEQAESPIPVKKTGEETTH